MTDWQLHTPVALIIFNRPDTTARVFEAVAAAKPPLLLVVGDGPRAQRPGEAERCAQARAIVQRVDWHCEVRTCYADANLGSSRRVSSGLDWIFEQVEEAIILEDDCVPHASFFRYCEELLIRYRHDDRVGMISGDNFQFGTSAGPGSYYFSKYAHIWGWATWRRAWRHYDMKARIWPEFLASGALSRLTEPCEREGWIDIFDRIYAGKLDTWDYQWVLTCWAQSMLAVMPQVNLISNVGFGADATRTRHINRYAFMTTEAVSWPLRAPGMVAADRIADRRTAQEMFSPSWLRRVKLRLRRL